DELLTVAIAGQARVAAKKKGDAEVRELERRLAAEKARREAAEVEAARNKALYEEALKRADDALTAKNYDVAVAKYEEASKVYNTPVVLTGLNKARTLQREEKARADAEAKRKADETARVARLKQLRDDGAASLRDRKYDQAVTLLTQASQLA